MILNLLTKIRKDKMGATATEYGLIAAAVATVIAGGTIATGSATSATFCSVANSLSIKNQVSLCTGSGVGNMFKDTSQGGTGTPEYMPTLTNQYKYASDIMSVLSSLNSKDPVTGVYGLYGFKDAASAESTFQNNENSYLESIEAKAVSTLSSEDQSEFQKLNDITSNGGTLDDAQEAEAKTLSNKVMSAMASEESSDPYNPYSKSDYQQLSSYDDAVNYLTNNPNGDLGLSASAFAQTTAGLTQDVTTNQAGVEANGFSIPMFQVTTQSGDTYTYYSQSNNSTSNQQYGYFEDSSGNVINHTAYQ